jgi:hypothetical protein
VVGPEIASLGPSTGLKVEQTSAGLVLNSMSPAENRNLPEAG